MSILPSIINMAIIIAIVVIIVSALIILVAIKKKKNQEKSNMKLFENSEKTGERDNTKS